ncbi:patatin-like phospholipase family protein [Acinetobacter seifertii]|uniref:patatin-like phospholipase family protein n=1 Tax=Acinetobacter seifertii TaxID=1530123 RepID=UPI0032B3FB88
MSNLALDIQGNENINQMIKEIKDKITKSPISDLVDDSENQYVDLVLQGGGVLGIALVGYTYALEQAGLRFLNIAGTSAGAINALFLAALGKPNSSKSIELLEIFNGMDMKSFIDGGLIAEALVDDIKNKDNFITAILPKLGILAAECKFSKNKLGVNPGKTFEEWLKNELKKRGITTNEQLLQNLVNPQDLRIRNRPECSLNQKDIEDDLKESKLAIVAADVTTQTKVIFPQMADLYWDNYKEVSPCKFVRASMSIPLFFEPLVIDKIPKGKESDWDQKAGYKGDIPSSVYFVDGGIVSNFPIDIFHQKNRVPLCPTFGVKLHADRNEIQNIDNIKDFLVALFDRLCCIKPLTAEFS